MSIKQDDPDGKTITRRGIGAHQSCPEQPPTSVANDKDCNDSWPLVPFPEGHLGTPSGQQESNRRLSTESACPSHYTKKLPLRRQFRPAFAHHGERRWVGSAFGAAVSIAMFDRKRDFVWSGRRRPRQPHLNHRPVVQSRSRYSRDTLTFVDILTVGMTWYSDPALNRGNGNHVYFFCRQRRSSFCWKPRRYIYILRIRRPHVSWQRFQLFRSNIRLQVG
jgi:hypothetical protein